MTITYSHCVKFTFGQLDRAPFSFYVTKTETVEMLRHSGDSIGPDDWFSISWNGQYLASGDTKADCISAASYRLMSIFREVARQESRLRQGVAA